MGMLRASGIILAGGKSSRMGVDKSLLKMKKETMIARIAGLLQGSCEELLIVSNALNKYGLKGAREISDIYPGMGPLAGIHAGLQSAAHEYAFVAACDMPFVTEPLIKLLMQRCTGYDVTVPQTGDYLEPLLAVYTKGCIPHIEACLKRDMRKITAFYPKVRVNYVNENLIRTVIDPARAFYNINTPRDYRKLGRHN